MRAARRNPGFPMALCRSIHGKWNYCPTSALDILGRLYQYEVEGFDSEADARAAIEQDRSIPRPFAVLTIADWTPV